VGVEVVPGLEGVTLKRAVAPAVVEAEGALEILGEREEQEAQPLLEHPQHLTAYQ
jgi:hypothetical protein